jgi:hypothetical protein
MGGMRPQNRPLGVVLMYLYSNLVVLFGMVRDLFIPLNQIHVIE